MQMERGGMCYGDDREVVHEWMMPWVIERVDDAMGVIERVGDAMGVIEKLCMGG